MVVILFLEKKIATNTNGKAYGCSSMNSRYRCLEPPLCFRIELVIRKQGTYSPLASQHGCSTELKIQPMIFLYQSSF